MLLLFADPADCVGKHRRIACGFHLCHIGLTRVIRVSVNAAKSVKPADTPDFVHASCPACDRHSSGLGVAPPARCYLPASSAEPPQNWPTWYCCAQRLPVSPRLNWLVSVALILSLCLAVFTGEPLAPALPYAVRTFLQCVVSHTTLTRCPCGMHQRRPSRLHNALLSQKPIHFAVSKVRSLFNRF